MRRAVWGGVRVRLVVEVDEVCQMLGHDRESED